MTLLATKQNILDDIKSLNPSARLMAVSKRQTGDRIEASLKLGHRLYGENRVQEAMERWTARRDTYDDLELHLIGALQTNKVQEAVALFDCIQTLDREKLARAVVKEQQKQDKTLSYFIQINTGAEDQKSGISPHELKDFLDFCRTECVLNVIGLMCIPPADEPVALHFALLKKLADVHNLPELSMGMSSDYQKALKLGASIVRVGSAFFGERLASSA